MIYRILFTGFLFCLISSLQAQDKDLVQAVAKEACDCMGTKNLDGITSEQLNMDLGLCIMESLTSRSDDTEEFNLDFTDNQAMHNFGEQVGMQMVTECPSLMMKIVSMQEEEGQETASEETSNRLVGTFKGIQGEDFAFLTLEGDDGSVYRLLWLGEFDGAELLETARNQRVEISFREIECYAPKMKKYLTRKEVLSMKVL